MEEFKKQIREEFDEKFGSQKDHRTRDIGNELIDTVWYYYEVEECEIKSFIDSLIDKTVQHERERIVGVIEEAQKTIRLEQFTVDTIISLITNKSDINKLTE